MGKIANNELNREFHAETGVSKVAGQHRLDSALEPGMELSAQTVLSDADRERY